DHQSRTRPLDHAGHRLFAAVASGELHPDPLEERHPRPHRQRRAAVHGGQRGGLPGAHHPRRGRQHRPGRRAPGEHQLRQHRRRGPWLRRPFQDRIRHVVPGRRRHLYVPLPDPGAPGRRHRRRRGQGRGRGLGAALEGHPAARPAARAPVHPDHGSLRGPVPRLLAADLRPERRDLQPARRPVVRGPGGELRDRRAAGEVVAVAAQHVAGPERQQPVRPRPAVLDPLGQRLRRVAVRHPRTLRLGPAQVHVLRSPMMRMLLLAILAMAMLPVAVAAPVDPAPPLPAGVTAGPSLEGVSEYRLDNGLRVLLVPDASASTVQVQVVYLAGSRSERDGATGAAHLLEHMMFKGTPSHPDITAGMAAHGVSFSASTSYDRTVYSTSFDADPDRLAWVLGMEPDRMVHSSLRAEDLASEMTVVRNEFEGNENNELRVLKQRLRSAAYDWHPYGNALIGARSDLENVPIGRLREFYRRWYRPDNAVLL